MSWTNNVSERGAKAAKRHQAVSALDAIRGAITGKPWLPPLPAAA
ncbi:MAG: hypothetical protein ACRDNS_35965 [Trebonia sp.]